MGPVQQALSLDVLRALADPRRVAIIAQLASEDAPQTVSALTRCCGIDFSGVSRHLKILRDAGVVSVERDGREARYSLQADDLADRLDAMARAIRDCC